MGRALPKYHAFMHAEELWTAESPKARFLRTLLTPLSWLYALGWQAYLGVYKLGLKKPKEPHAPVVCIGNLLVGGTGKTPMTAHVAEVLRELGYYVVISCSGYGSPASEAARLAPEGPLKASEWGDEAALLRDLHPSFPLIVGRRRVLAAEICNQHFPDSVLLMDDGFQHLPLKKHVTILLDPPQPNHRCLPAGPYREPRGNLRRADLAIGPSSAGVPMLRLTAEPTKFSSSSGGQIDVTGGIDVLCALGRPQGFLEALKSQGLTIMTARIKADHDPLTDGNLLEGLGEGRPIVVTGKDWVKLRERPDAGNYDFAIASHSVAIEPGVDFRDWLRMKLNGVLQKKG